MKPHDAALIEGLHRALEADPANVPVRLHLAGLLGAAGRPAEARDVLRAGLAPGREPREIVLALVPLLRETGELAEGLIRVESLLAAGPTPALHLEHARILQARGDAEAAWESYRRAVEGDPALADPSLEALGKRAVAAQVAPEGLSESDWASQFDWGDLRVRFEDVAGLEEVKKQIDLRILAPYRKPEIFQAFGRKAGGGILLYGPPGCGKTYVARATAGELGARFLGVGIADVLDKYWGESERVLHALFAEARRRTPTVLFFDEFDALGSSRGRSESQFWKAIVDQLLQEMDGLAGGLDGILVFAATNVPWNVDSAFRRPGRFDRVLFVPPPDETARAAIVQRALSKLPGGATVDARRVAVRTHLFTGADLVALCERASERALSRSLETGEVHPVTEQDFLSLLPEVQSTAEEWLATARNHARYSNEGGKYDELAAFLKKAKRW